MENRSERWIDSIVAENALFRRRIKVHKLPTEREQGQLVITCMDPRVNLEAMGISGFQDDGRSESTVRVVRTIGAIAEDRSLIVGVYLAGIREVIVLMHTDCGCCRAHSRTEAIASNMERMLEPAAYRSFREEVGEPFAEQLKTYLNTFEEPSEAVRREVARIRRLKYIPEDVVVHGLLYELKSGKVEVVIDGNSR